jgi:hypothetical protein
MNAFPVLVKFWDYSRAMGNKPAPVWAVMAPDGRCLSWAVHKGRAANDMDRLSNNGPLCLVRVVPNAS